MGTSRSVNQLVAKMDAYAASIPTVEREAANAAGLAVKATVVPLMAAATGGDLQLSGTAKAGGAARAKKIGVSYTVKKIGDTIAVVIGAIGPAHLVENDVGRHFVFSRHARAKGGPKARTKSSTVNGVRTRIDTRVAAAAFGIGTTGERRAVLHWGDVYRRWTVSSSRGRHPWARGVKAARPRITKAWQAAHDANLKRRFT